MSLLKYFSRAAPRYRDSQLPDPNGPLSRVVPSSAIPVADKSVSVSLESNKKAAMRGVYQKLSAEKKTEIGERSSQAWSNCHYDTVPQSFLNLSVWT